MDSLLLDMLNKGLTIEQFFTLLQLMFVFFVALAIKNKITDLVSYTKVKGNKKLAEGVVVYLPTSTGSVRGYISKISFNKIEITTDNTIEIIPITQFANDRKSIERVDNDINESDE